MSVDWEEIRREHAPLMWEIAWRILQHEADALDCCQEVFAEAVERSRKAPVENWPAFLNWLTTHRSIDSLRRRKREQNRTSGCTQKLNYISPTNDPVVGSNIEYEELDALVRRHLLDLNQIQAEVFWLACVERMSYQDVAQQTGLTVSAVGVNVHRARDHLKKNLSQFLSKADLPTALKPIKDSI